MSYTTILVTPETRRKLGELKEYQRETYEEVLSKLLSLIPEKDDEGKYLPEFKASILRGMVDGSAGRVYSEEEVRKSLGLK